MNATRARLALASALTAAVALGAAASADAAPRTTVKATAKTTTKDARVAAAAAKRLAAAKQAVLRQITVKGAALTRTEALVVRANLGAGSTSAIRANIAADRTQLEALKATLASATTLTAVGQVNTAVAAFRPQNYDQVRTIVALDNRTLAAAAAQVQTIAETSAAADAKEAEGADVTAVREALADATAFNAEAVAAANRATAAALTVRATTNRTVDQTLRTARTDAAAAATALQAAATAIEQAQAALEAAVVPVTDPATTDPATTDPATTDPATTDPATTA